MFSTQSCASFLKATIYSSRQSGGSGQVWRKTRLRRLMKCYWKHCPFDRPFAPAMPLCTNSNIAQRVNAQREAFLLSRGSPFLLALLSICRLAFLLIPRLVISFRLHCLETTIPGTRKWFLGARWTFRVEIPFNLALRDKCRASKARGGDDDIIETLRFWKENVCWA